MKTLRKSRRHARATVVLATGLLAASLLTPLVLRAQDTPQADAAEKTSLMVQALAARTAGDYAKEKDALTRLQVLEPGATDVQNMLDQANKDLASPPALAAPATTTASTAPAPMPANSGSTAAPMAPASGGGGSASAPAPMPMAAPAPAPMTPEQMALAAAATQEKQQIADAAAAIKKAQSYITAHDYNDAHDLLVQTKQNLPPGIDFDPVLADINRSLGNAIYGQAVDAYNIRKNDQAKAKLDEYIAVVGNDSRAKSFAALLAAAPTDATHQDVDVVSPGFTSTKDNIQQLLVKARAQYLYGDYEGALTTFREVTIKDPDNLEAKTFQDRIFNYLYDTNQIDRELTRTQMLIDVERAWSRPQLYQSVGGPNPTAGKVDEVTAKLRATVIPQVDFQSMPLDVVTTTLAALSQTYDPDKKGVNFSVVGDAPSVTLTLNNATLEQILKAISSQTKFAYEVEDGIVTFRKSEVNTQMTTQDYPLPRSVVNRLTGLYVGGGASAGGAGGSSTDVFAAGGGAAGGTNPDDVNRALQTFFKGAGVDFPEGARLNWTGEKLYVTDTDQNLTRVGSVLRQYNDVKQVEIEARFLEVQQGALQELGFQWNVANSSQPNNLLRTTFIPSGSQTGSTFGVAPVLRSLADTVTGGAAAAGSTVISVAATPASNGTAGTSASSTTIPSQVPSLPGGINAGAGATSIFSGVLGVVNGFDVQMIINALEQTQGADLMSAPKVTVLSGRHADITVAQKLRYPKDFGPTQSQVGQSGGGSTNGGGSAGVTITAGVPQDFDVEDVGVVFSVDPRVGDDNTIEMDLHPHLVEFEGFIEYGGISVAVQGGTTVTVPSGFIQPVFSEREVETTVTIFDGATVVLGGLTREEVTTVSDKVPVLGDIPLLGRLFQSKGESSEKRNLMIFVTANLISPGGAVARQHINGINSDAVFQNPEMITPGGSSRRLIQGASETRAAAASGVGTTGQ